MTTLTRDDMNDDLGTHRAIVAALATRHVIASLEYPGFLNIDLPNHTALAVGDMNGAWDADHMTEDFDVLNESERLGDLDATADQIADAVVALIAKIGGAK